MTQNYPFHSKHLSQASLNNGIQKKHQQRTSMKMVASVFEPPQQTEASYKNNDGKSLQFTVDNKTIGNYTQITNEPINANIEFIKSLVSLKQCINYEEGDSVPLDTEDRWIVTSGELKITGTNGYHYTQGAGYIFFVSPQTKKKIKQVLAITSTIMYKISQAVFKEHIRNYLFVKNSEKIKYLKYCPFLTWNHNLAQDIAVTIEFMENLQKDCEIYQYGDEAQYLYFVKEGIVLLERLGKIGNNIIKQYEKHYESTHLSEEEGLLIVRKGMIFGVDGILIKEKNIELKLENPEQKLEQISSLTRKQQITKNTRIYNAKSIGNCEIYRLKKSVIETYFRMADILKKSEESKKISQKQLDRICLQYTNLLMGMDNQKQSLKKKQFNFLTKLNVPVDQQFIKKKKKIQQIKEHEKKVRKNYAGSIDSNRKNQKEQIMVEQNPFKKNSFQNKLEKKYQSIKDFSLPTLHKRQLQKQFSQHIEKVINKKLSGKETEKYITYKRKIEESLVIKEKSTSKQFQKNQEKSDNLQFMKVKSYRSLLSSLN